MPYCAVKYAFDAFFARMCIIRGEKNGFCVDIKTGCGSICRFPRGPGPRPYGLRPSAPPAAARSLRSPGRAVRPGPYSIISIRSVFRGFCKQRLFGAPTTYSEPFLRCGGACMLRNAGPPFAAKGPRLISKQFTGESKFPYLQTACKVV